MRLIVILWTTFALAGCNFNHITDSDPYAVDAASVYTDRKNFKKAFGKHPEGLIWDGMKWVGSTARDIVARKEPLPKGYWKDLTGVKLSHLCERATFTDADGKTKWAYFLNSGREAMKELDRRKEDCGLPPRIYPQ